MRCPKCRTLVLTPPAVAGDAGSLCRCPRCAAVWVARPHDGIRAALPVPPALVRPAPRIIEGEAAPAGQSGRRWWAFGRAGLVATLAAFAFGLAATVLLSPGVSAGPETVPIEARR